MFMHELKIPERTAPFDEQLFIRTVEQITGFPDKRIFVFKDGRKFWLRNNQQISQPSLPRPQSAPCYAFQNVVY